MDGGYCGKILRVDLSNEKITDEPLDESDIDRIPEE